MIFSRVASHALHIHPVGSHVHIYLPATRELCNLQITMFNIVPASTKKMAGPTIAFPRRTNTLCNFLQVDRSVRVAGHGRTFHVFFTVVVANHAIYIS